MSPFICYTAMKNKYLKKVVDFRHQVDHITPNITIVRRIQK